MSQPKYMTSGQHLIVIGLILQIISFCLFIATGGIFHFRIIRSPTTASIEITWQKYMYALYGSSILILIRSVFRVIEFSGGNDDILMRSEIFLYSFDSILMLGVEVFFNLVYPGQIIGPKSLGQIVTLDSIENLNDVFKEEQKLSFGSCVTIGG